MKVLCGLYSRRAVALSAASRHVASAGGSSAEESASVASVGSSVQRAPRSPCSSTIKFPTSLNISRQMPVSQCITALPPTETIPIGNLPPYEELINFKRSRSSVRPQHLLIASFISIHVYIFLLSQTLCVMCGRKPEDGISIPQQNKVRDIASSIPRSTC